MKLTFEVPMKAPSTPNQRLHWRALADRTSAQKAAVYKRVPVLDLPTAYVVTLTRIGPRRLDSDNVQGALKGVRDSVAKRIGVDDGSTIVRWEYGQEVDAKGKERVRIEVASVGHVEPASPPPDWDTARMRELLEQLRKASAELPTELVVSSSQLVAAPEPVDWKSRVTSNVRRGGK